VSFLREKEFLWNALFFYFCAKKLIFTKNLLIGKFFEIQKLRKKDNFDVKNLKNAILI
jgi:hypothetical protein